MTSLLSNLAGLAGAVAVIIAVAGLAGPLWAVLVLGLVLALVAYALNSQRPVEEATSDAIARAIKAERRRWEHERLAAEGEAAVRHGRQIDELVDNHKAALARLTTEHDRVLAALTAGG